MWYVNTAPAYFKAPRGRLMENVRSEHRQANWRVAEASDDDNIDPDDPHPIVRLLNRQYLGYELDPVEVYETLDIVDSLIIGDPEHCMEKMQKFREIGFDRLLCLQQFGFLPHERVMQSIRLVGEELLPYV